MDNTLLMILQVTFAFTFGLVAMLATFVAMFTGAIWLVFKLIDFVEDM